MIIIFSRITFVFLENKTILEARCYFTICLLQKHACIIFYSLLLVFHFYDIFYVDLVTASRNACDLRASYGFIPYLYDLWYMYCKPTLFSLDYAWFSIVHCSSGILIIKSKSTWSFVSFNRRNIYFVQVASNYELKLMLF